MDHIEPIVKWRAVDLVIVDYGFWRTLARRGAQRAGNRSV